LCKDKDKIKKERQEAKKLRTKIVGVGNTMDSYGDKIQTLNSGEGQNEVRSHSGHKRGYENEDYKKDTNPTNSYDPYHSTKPLSEKIGVILDDVSKVNDGDNSETIRQKIGNKNKMT